MSGPLGVYLVALRRRWRMVAAIPLLFVIVAAALLLLTPMQYRSTAVLFVSTPRDGADTAYQGDAYSKGRMNSYILLGKSPEIAQKVAENIGQDISPAALLDDTTLTAVPGTVLLELTTTGSTPQNAQTIGQAYVDQLRRSVAALEAVPGALTPRAELIPIQPPTYNDSAGTFPPWLLLGAAGGLGLAIGGLLAVVASVLDGRIRRPEDAAEATGSPVLATFPSLVPWEQPIAADWAAEAGRRLRMPLDRLTILGSRIILITSAEEGAGKSGVALTACRALADRGSSVALVDFDSRSSRLASALGLGDAGDTVRSLVAETVVPSAEDVSEQSADGRHHRLSGNPRLDRLSKNWHGVVVIPFGPQEDNAGATADAPSVEPLFHELRATFDWIVVDSPANSRASDASRIAHVADAVLLIAQASQTKFDQLRSTAEELERAGGHVAGVVFVDDARPNPSLEARQTVDVAKS